MSKRDYYDILGVSRTATAELIRAAHRVQSRRYHPDTADEGKGDARLFAEIQEAYETLSNPDNRRRYDTRQGFHRGEFSAGGIRRPPRSPCARCGKSIVASQLRNYLGRYLCNRCFEQKQIRQAKRPRLTPTGELRWQLKRVQIWTLEHGALLAVMTLAVGAAGVRLATVAARPHRFDRPPEQREIPVSTSAAPLRLPTGALPDPCRIPPLPSSETVDIGSTRPSEKP